MDQERTVNAILRDMKTFKVIQCDSDEAVKQYLKLLWLVGWEEGRADGNQHTNKPIGQFDKDGRLINTFKSIDMASRKTGFSLSTISKSLHMGRITRPGWVWKYLEGSKKPSKKQKMKEYFEEYEKNINGEIL